MSRTIKALPYGCHRPVKGHNRAIKAKIYEEGVPPVRNGAIPPDPWEDLMHDNQVYKPYKIVEELLKKNKSAEFIAKRVSKNFGISQPRVMEIVRMLERRYKKYERREE